MKHHTLIWPALFILAGTVLFPQCSPYAGKSVLNFFFDGVPESDSSSLAQVETGRSAYDSLSGSEELLASVAGGQLMHGPFGEGECALCHNEQALGRMLEPEPGLCYTCHENLAGQFNYLHGPVAGGYCTACHDPHRSENEKLLRRTGEALCYFCHDGKRIPGTEMHQDLDGMLCTDCHNPHGGDDKYIFQ